MNIAVLASGGLGFDTLKKLSADRDIKFVFTDSGSNEISKWCELNGIPFFKGNPREGKGAKELKGREIDVLLSVNYLFIIEKDLIECATKYAINLHGSLLPKYRGRTPHVWAIINNEIETGVTAHEIAEGCDTGKIIRQVSVPILKNDTGGTLLEKYSKIYYPLIQEVLDSIENETIEFKEQDEELATYFGKRTPEDGLIDWTWKSLDIRNWVRAQSNPYPGAFTYINQKKIIVDWVEPRNMKFEETAGTIVSTSPLLVKTGDGVVELTKLRTKCTFEKGQKFKND